jgi:hypothetical protein
MGWELGLGNCEAIAPALNSSVCRSMAYFNRALIECTVTVILATC